MDEFMTNDFDKIISVIKEQYHNDVALMDMIYYLDKNYKDKIKLLKDNGIGYTISDYTDDELIELDNDVLLKVCSRNIYELITYYNESLDIEFADIIYDAFISRFVIRFKYNISSHVTNYKEITSDDMFYVSINELRNPLIFKENYKDYIIEEIEDNIKSLQLKLDSLKNND